MEQEQIWILNSRGYIDNNCKNNDLILNIDHFEYKVSSYFVHLDIKNNIYR